MPDTVKPLQSRDDDHDGLLAAEDRCPKQAEDFDGFEDEDGCPDVDNDGERSTFSQGIIRSANRPIIGQLLIANETE